jgi:serine/threonine protein kinase
MSQTGGELIGEGVYGCAFDPPLVCKRQNGRNAKNGQKAKKAKQGERVGKISKVEDAQAEYEISRFLQEIPDAQKYFILIDNLCTPLPRSQQTEKDLKKCKAIENKALESFAQLSMPFGGKPLSAIRISASNIDLWQFGKHLLEAGSLMLLHGIVHFDLHRGNVLMNTRTTGRLIDFGLAWKPEELSLANVPLLYRTFNPAINQEPPEVSVINGILDGTSTIEADIKLTIQNKGAILLYSNLFQIPPQTLDKELYDFIAGSWSFEKKHWYSFYKLYWTKMDSWAIGVMILSVYNDLLRDREFITSDSYLKKKTTMENVIRHLCSMSAVSRWDCLEALSIWAPDSHILQKVDAVRWLEVKQEERAALKS